MKYNASRSRNQLLLKWKSFSRSRAQMVKGCFLLGYREGELSVYAS